MAKAAAAPLGPALQPHATVTVTGVPLQPSMARVMGQRPGERHG